jgi:exodeoxyribonuclease-3
MRIISLNINGIRAGARKGFFTWLTTQNADVVCLQEIKAEESQLTDAVFHPEGYHRYCYSAQKKGYSGVAIYCREKPQKVHYGLGFELADNEGRYLQVDFVDMSVASLYLPSGTSGDERQQQKYYFLDAFNKTLKALKRKKREAIICGDFNIVHKEIDIKNWKGNQKNSGCLPEERAWLDKVFGEFGWVDAFREVNQQAEQYTWWSNRGNARTNNVGWRIDYHIVTPGLKDKIKTSEIYKEQWFSDHAPVILEYQR